MRRSSTASEDIVIRRGYPDDRDALVRLATLDSAPAPAGPVLLAEVGGELRAALDLERETMFADPFRPTAHLAALLRVQARAVRPAGVPGRSRAGALLRAVLRPTTPLGHRAV
jgi:hypothetical protein